ncbi:SWIM zinc finger family protein [Streptomyces solicavernae]
MPAVVDQAEEPSANPRRLHAVAEDTDAEDTDAEDTDAEDTDAAHAAERTEPQPANPHPANPHPANPHPANPLPANPHPTQPAGTPLAAPLPTHPTAARPGDVAREALWAARREQGPQEGDGGGDVRGAAGGATGHASPRPGRSGDTVSELKRMAREGRRSMRGPGEGEAPPPPEPHSEPHPEPNDAPAPAPSRAARSALARAGAERRRAARGDEAKPVRTGKRRRRRSEDGPSAPATPHPGTAPATPATPAATGPTARRPETAEDLRRTFPAEGADDSAGDRSWWGTAWVDALEESALDPARLARGRDYAGHGRVDAVTVTPGLLLAYVHGSRPRPYRAKITLPTFTDEEWDRFLDAAAAQPGHIAALLDREMPRSLADCGVPLLPAPGELHPECSCPDSGRPCKHAAALCYRTARLLDEDPFVLLLLRGRGERGLLAELSRRNATLAARNATLAARNAANAARPDPTSPTAVRITGVRARDALAPRALQPLPRPLPPLPHPEQPPAYPAAAGGPDPFALDQLATDAASRAHALLATGQDPVAGLTLWQDAVRIAAARPGSGLTAAGRAQYESLAAAAGRTATDLARAVAAWRQGGRAGLAVLEEPWDPPAGRFDQARPALRAAEFPHFTPHRNRLTHPEGTLQLRLGQDGSWYAYESEPGRDDWWPRGTPDHDPVGALTAAATPGHNHTTTARRA